MVSAFLTWKRLTMAALLLSTAAAFTKAQAQGEAQPAGGGGLGATNFRTAGGAEKTVPGQGRLEKFEDDVFGTHKLNVGIPSVDSPSQHRRLLVVPAPDAQAREKMDAQKNWVFSGMNELDSSQKPEDLMGMSELGPDGLMKPKLSAVEKYYNGLGGGRSADSNRTPDVLTMMWAVKQLSSTNSLSPLIFAFPGGDQTLMKSLMTLPELNHAADGDTASPDDSTSTSAAIAAASTAAATDREQKRRQDTFKQILGIGPEAPASFGGTDSFAPIQPVATPLYNPGSSPASAPFTPSSLSPVTAGFTPAAVGSYHPYDGGLAGPANGSAGMNYQSQPALFPQPSRPTLPPALDPFTANFPKRKF
jgi:hypothetical protein